MIVLDFTDDKPTILHPLDMTVLAGAACPPGLKTMSLKEMARNALASFKLDELKDEGGAIVRPSEGQVLQYLFLNDHDRALENVDKLNQSSRLHTVEAFQPEKLVDHISAFGANMAQTSSRIFAGNSTLAMANALRGEKFLAAWHYVCNQSPENFQKAKSRNIGSIRIKHL